MLRNEWSEAIENEAWTSSSRCMVVSGSIRLASDRVSFSAILNDPPNHPERVIFHFSRFMGIRRSLSDALHVVIELQSSHLVDEIMQKKL